MRSSLAYLTPAASLLVLSLAACGGDDGGGNPDAGLPPLTNATSLACPAPGALPFRLASTGFLSLDNQKLATADPQNKDEASDAIGNPGGPIANVYIEDAATPSDTAPGFVGRKARTTPDAGLLSNPLPAENVSLWFYDTAGKAWQSEGTGKTDIAGAYKLTASGSVAPNGEPVYAMLDADGSCAVHYNYLYPAGTKVVVVDIDGTLTTDNQQIIMQLTNEAYVPKMMTAGNAMVTEWVKKGYPVIYLTARIHTYRPESRSWLASQGFPRGPMITENGGEKADVYKTNWLTRMKTTFGWDIVAAYGNAQTDLDAYHAVGIPAAQTFIIGPLGDTPTTPASTSIPGMDYTAHITSYIDAQPDVTPAPPGTGPAAAMLH